jgi:hypothetical protein
LHFIAPDFMSGWVEATAVVDINNRFFPRRGGGGIGDGDFYEGETYSARGWGKHLGGNGSSVTGADLPRRIYVRWQSSVEPQTYQGWIEVPEEARQLMVKSTARRCAKRPESRSNYNATVILGLAPGGIIQMWVEDECLRSIPFGRAQVDIEPLGPDLGKSNGYYVRQTEGSKEYVKRFGIPYGSW